MLVRYADERRTVQELEDLVVFGGDSGAELRLGQIATITDQFELAEDRAEFNGRRAALLQVSKTDTQDTLTVMAAARAFVEQEQARAPPGVSFIVTRDIASIVQDRLDMLTENALLGFVLVFLVLWLFFSFRFSFWVAMALPTSFMGAFLVLTAIDYSINMLTMVALLIALGLLMDDSIVIAENIASHLQRGKSRLQAAVDAIGEVGQGVLSSFATSVCVFTPLGVSGGRYRPGAEGRAGGSDRHPVGELDRSLPHPAQSSDSFLAGRTSGALSPEVSTAPSPMCATAGWGRPSIGRSAGDI